MKILKKDRTVVKLEIESLDDLWYLSHVVEPGDLVSSKTERKIKIGGDDDRKAKVVRKFVFLTLEAEKIEFSTSLRISGKITQGTDDVPAGSYHTIDVEEGSKLEIQKEEWPKYLLDKLKEASAKEGVKVLIVCHDREDASFGLLTRRGLEVLSTLKGDVAKKGMDEGVKDDFYKHIAKILKEYHSRQKPDAVVVASPGFWKEYLMTHVIDLNPIQASCSTVGERGLQEVVKRPELKQVLEQDRTRKDEAKIEEVMAAIAKDEACYGLGDCEEKLNLGAVKELLVSDNFIQKAREEGKYKQVDTLLRAVEKMDGSVHIISSKEASAKLDGLAGIAGILRWKI